MSQKRASSFDFQKSLSTLTRRPDDNLYAVLKAHLLFEEMLRQHLAQLATNGEHLEGARLTFSQLIALNRAMSPNIEADSWLWSAIIKLNKLRNIFAHELSDGNPIKEVESYINFCLTYFPPLPPLPLSNNPAHSTSQHKLHISLVIINFSILAIIGEKLGIPLIDI